MSKTIHVLNAIGGVWREAKDGRRLDDVGPSDGAVIATIPRSSGHDVEDAVIAAESAQAAWGARSIEERAKMLDAIADVMEAHADDLAKLESLDTGKPWDVARHVDIDRCVRNFRFFAELGRTSPQQTFAMDDAMNHVLRKPIGVVGLISPWNLPLYLLTWKVAPALLLSLIHI